MRVASVFVGGCTLALLGGSPFLTSAHAQEPKPAEPRGPEARRVEVYNGPIRTVTYDLTGLSPRLQALYRQLELAENELSLTDQLGALKQEYVNNERKLEARRTWLQLYGYPGPGGAGLGYSGGSVIKSRIAPTLGLASTAGYRLQVITNLEEAQRSLAEEEERERRPARQPAGVDKGGPPAPAKKKPERNPPPPAAAKPAERTSKNEPAAHAEKQAARRKERAADEKHVHAAGPDRQTADPEWLAQHIREQFELVSRQLSFPVIAASAGGAKHRAPVPFDPVARMLLTVPRPAVAPEPPRPVVAAHVARTDPPPPEVGSWSERLGWLSAGAMACFSLLTLGWSCRGRMRGLSQWASATHTQSPPESSAATCAAQVPVPPASPSPAQGPR